MFFFHKLILSRLSQMKLTTITYVIVCVLFFDMISANPDIDELKRNSKTYLSDIKNEFFLIKKKIISPQNKRQFPYESFLDSLYFLSKKLDTQRKNMFSDLIGLDLTSKDYQYFDNLNRDSILLYNIIQSFRKIYRSYLSYDKSNRDYSFKQYALDMQNLLLLEKKLF